MAREIKRILYVSPTSIFDQSNGASISIRTLMKGLGARGYTARSLNATIFDHPDGGKPLMAMMKQPLDKKPSFLIKHGENYTTTIRTAHPARAKMTSHEQYGFFVAFTRALADLKPDVVITWGSGVLDLLIMSEAKRAGIPVVFYLVNTGYDTPFWKRDVSYFITDSEATSAHYRKEQDLDVHAIGKFFDRDDYVAETREPKYFTFVNPQRAKGMQLFAQIALMARTAVPEARFLVIESRGKWVPALKSIGLSPKEFTNVDIAPLQDSMKPVYGMTRTLLVPSYGQDSGPRVIGEAMLNGIPVLGSANGGIAEHVGAGGRTFPIPAEVTEDRTGLPPEEVAAPWIEEIRRHVTEPDYYAALSASAAREAEKYDVNRAIDKLIGILEQ